MIRLPSGARASGSTASWTWSTVQYPQYDIERTGEDRYRISLALAGFGPEEITITTEPTAFTIEGRKSWTR
jgi:molecular chaperone IbpA